MTQLRFNMLLNELQKGAPMRDALAVAGLNTKDLIHMRRNQERDEKIKQAQHHGKMVELERKREMNR